MAGAVPCGPEVLSHPAEESNPADRLVRSDPSGPPVRPGPAVRAGLPAPRSQVQRVPPARSGPAARQRRLVPADRRRLPPARSGPRVPAPRAVRQDREARTRHALRQAPEVRLLRAVRQRPQARALRAVPARRPRRVRDPRGRPASRAARRSPPARTRRRCASDTVRAIRSAPARHGPRPARARRRSTLPRRHPSGRSCGWRRARPACCVSQRRRAVNGFRARNANRHALCAHGN